MGYNNRNTEIQKSELVEKALTSGYTYATLAGAGVCAFLASRYHVSPPNQFIAKTGPFVKGANGISVHKNTFQLPWQKIEKVEANPINFSFVSKAMSQEKLELQLPATFTIGPKSGDPEALQRYAEKFCGMPNGKMQEIIEGVIEGAVRIEVGSLTIEDVFANKAAFKKAIQESIGEELNQYGLHVYSANIKELQDTEGSEYFQFLRQKTTEGAVNRAKVEVAEVKKIGDIGEKERQTETRIKVAQFDAEAIEAENQRTQQVETSKAELEKRKAELKKEVEIAQIEAKLAAQLKEQELQMGVKLREQELQIGVEMKKQEQETERLRAADMSKAKVQAETLVRESQGKADAIKIRATAEAEAQRVKAEANLFEELQKSQAVRAMYEAKALGLERMTQACGGDFKNVLQQMMIEQDMYTKLARENAQAIKGLNPKFTVWNTNNGIDAGSNPVGDIFKNLPPLLTTIKEQTGMELPEWLVKMPQSKKEQQTKKQ